MQAQQQLLLQLQEQHAALTSKLQAIEGALGSQECMVAGLANLSLSVGPAADSAADAAAHAAADAAADAAAHVADEICTGKGKRLLQVERQPHSSAAAATAAAAAAAASERVYKQRVQADQAKKQQLQQQHVQVCACGI